MNNRKELQFGPSRLIFFHSADPNDLGLQLVHSPTDGHVRIVPFHTADGENGRPSSPNVDGCIGRLGVVDGTVYEGTVVLEASGVNLRHSISEHMWKLTQGLMRVAPRPIEIVVAEEISEAVENESVEEREEEQRDVNGSYYQLDVGAQAQAAVYQLPTSPGGSPMRHPTSPGAHSVTSALSSPGGNIHSPGALPAQAVRDPFQDKDRFGAERTVTFHTESLGIKLHRSPTEAIVHILHVTPYMPFVSGGRNTDYKPPREGPDNGHLEPGDTILEVGGVDLRGKVIGVAEWADMVHFIKHVGRPLEIVVVKDKLFTRERAGLATLDNEMTTLQNQVMEVQQRKEREQQEMKKFEDEKKKEVEEIDEDQENVQPNAVVQEEDAEKESGEGQEMPVEEDYALNNTCFAVAADDICNMPCVGGDATEVATPLSKKDKPWMVKKQSDEEEDILKSETKSDISVKSPSRKDDSWIQKFIPDTPKEEDGEDEMSHGVPMTPPADLALAVHDEVLTSPAEKSVESSSNEKNKSWISVGSESKSERSPMPFYSRTNPAISPVSKAAASPVPTTPASSQQPSASPGHKNPDMKPTAPKDMPTDEMKDALNSAGVESETRKKRSVSQLKQMFSPIKNPSALSPVEVTSSIPESLSPIARMRAEQATSPGNKEGKPGVKPTAQLKGLFSPIVLDAATPKTPKSPVVEIVEKTEANNDDGGLPTLPLRAESPSDWSATSPYSDTSLAERSVVSPVESEVQMSVASPMEADAQSPIVTAVASVESQHNISPSQEKRLDLAQTILKGKRSPIRTKDDASERPVNDGIQVPQLEATATNQVRKPLEPTPSGKQPSAEDANDTPFHSVFLENLRDEFCSPDKMVQSSESRDDTEKGNKAKLGDATILPKPDRRNHFLAGWSSRPQEQHSPTGSTVSIKDKKTPATMKSAFAERSFRGGDVESPFVGDIKFATPNQRVPQSSLFSQAFVVQHQVNSGDGESENVRWYQTDSPLCIVNDGANDSKKEVGESSYLQFHSPRMQPPEASNLFQEPDVKGFNTSAFDMSHLDQSIMDTADEDSDNASFELNETIVYADSTEDAQMGCCGVRDVAFCGTENMFEGLVRDCGNMESFREKKEKVNGVPSPRRKNLLSRLRKKKSKANKKKVEYGNLNEEDEGQQQEMKVRKANVQLVYQNFRGRRSMAAANQFAAIVDDEICV